MNNFINILIKKTSATEVLNSHSRLFNHIKQKQ